MCRRIDVLQDEKLSTSGYEHSERVLTSFDSLRSDGPFVCSGVRVDELSIFTNPSSEWLSYFFRSFFRSFVPSFVRSFVRSCLSVDPIGQPYRLAMMFGASLLPTVFSLLADPIGWP